MNIERLKEILNSGIDDPMMSALVLKTIAEDENALPYIMEILSNERKQNSELISDMNMELSRAHIYIDECAPKELKTKEKTMFDRNFVLDKISSFYHKWNDKVSHCFNRFRPNP